MASMDELMAGVAGLRMVRLGVAFTLPADVTLHAAWDRVLRTAGVTLLRVGVTRDTLELAASPPIEVDVLWPAKNMALSGLTVHWATGAVEVHLAVRGGGLVGVEARARAELVALMRTTLGGTRAGRAGYDPFADQDLAGTLAACGRGFQGAPVHGQTRVQPESLGQMTVDVELEVVPGLVREGLRIPPAGRIAVAIHGAGALSQVMAARTADEAAQAAEIQHIALGSDALHLEAGGAPIGRLEAARILRGGTVHIDRLTLAGSARLAAGVEALITLLYRAGRLSSAGMGPEAAVRAAAHPALRGTGVLEPAARGVVEALLTEALAAVLASHEVVAGIRLRAALGMV